MSDVVLVQIHLSREAAEVLGDEAQRRRLGELVSDLLRPAGPDSDPLAALIAEIKADAAADGLTEEEVDAELAAYNAEGRVSRELKEKSSAEAGSIPTSAE